MTRLFITVVIALTFISCRMDTVLQEHKEFPQYPSASSVEFLDGRIYIMGDDATYMLVLDEHLHQVDSIPVYDLPVNRIPKKVKADLEAMALLPDKRLLLTGSASVKPFRYTGLIIDPLTKRVDTLQLDSFYRRFPAHGMEFMNIEGMTAIPGAMVLADRGNMSRRHNHLVFTSHNFWQEPLTAFINRSVFGFSSDSSSFQGVSGLAYSKKNDILIATVSTEATHNDYDDGPIGKSYLWLVKGISAKTRWNAINPDKVIDLESMDPVFRGKKIEGVTVVEETAHYLYLVLVADDDKGGSTVFRMTVKI